MSMGDSPRELSEELVTQRKRKKGWRMNCEVGEATEASLYLRHSSFSNPSVASPTSQFFLQPFFRFLYVTSSSLNAPGEPLMVMSLSTRMLHTIFQTTILKCVIFYLLQFILIPKAKNSLVVVHVLLPVVVYMFVAFSYAFVSYQYLLVLLSHLDYLRARKL